MLPVVRFSFSIARTSDLHISLAGQRHIGHMAESRAKGGEAHRARARASAERTPERPPAAPSRVYEASIGRLPIGLFSDLRHLNGHWFEQLAQGVALLQRAEHR
jgi:hypothetical protein